MGDAVCGCLVGRAVLGALVGLNVGTADGLVVGARERSKVGFVVVSGVAEGSCDSHSLGCTVGALEGKHDSCPVDSPGGCVDGKQNGWPDGYNVS